MLKKKIGKIVFVLFCIMTIVMPYTTNVFAALKKDDTTAKLQVLILHKGGEESSGTLTNEQKEFYDETPYGYWVGDTRVFKIVTEGDVDYTNSFYCLNGEKSFPGVTSSGNSSLEYKNVADFKDSTDSNVKSLHLSTSYSSDSSKWTSNYKALVWLMDNMYLGKQTASQKDAFLEKAFADYEDWDLETVKAFLTDDDIDVVQQYAIWYFTNRDTSKYNVTELPNIDLLKFDRDSGEMQRGSYKDFTEFPYRQFMADHLYKYLIEEAKKGNNTSAGSYPSIEDTTVTSKIEGNYYVTGPFKVKSGTVASSQYSMKLLNQSDVELSRSEYKILVDGEEVTKNINQIFDQSYYIAIPKTNKSITQLKLTLTYSSYETSATLWQNKTTNSEGVEIYQPVVLLIRENTPHTQRKIGNLNKDEADLALRKYIVKVNDKTINRNVTVDASKLANDTAKTATYKHAKDPVKVAVGDTVLYEIRVYNEADINARGTIIEDALPTGLELAPNSSINDTYNWEKVEDGNNRTIYSSDYLANTTIEAFDKNNVNSLVGNSKYVQIECKVTDAAKASTILTNVAEIADDGIDDRDSEPGNNEYVKSDYDSTNYRGDNSNPTDLTQSNYHYKGRQDDDDFEKIQIEGKAFDLSLQKFITKVNNSAPATSREPKVDVTPLKNGSSTNAKYNTVKTPLEVSKGDIVTYTIRVYNEGEIAGYAEEVADYIPDGLGFLVGHITNVDNYWSIPADSKTVKLSTIEDGTKNLKVEEFKDISNLNDVDVVVGKAKLTSTKLKSSASDTKNLIAEFDKKSGTTLSYKDLQVTCIVLADEAKDNNLRNVAEITKDLDKDRKEVTDIDSTPDSVNPDNYPGNDGNQDDNDYENLVIKKPGVEPGKFDLSLKKFITKVNDKAITGREPKVSKKTDGTFAVSSPSVNPLEVENNDLITYTIRVFNEGNMDGYAEEVSDDLPKGLVFVKDNETNKKYEWKLYDSNGKETTDLNQAVSVRTNYLSKAKSANNLIKASTSSSATLEYKDLQIVFKVDESVAKNNEGRKIINTAEITNDADKDGNPVDDIDSIPGNNKDGEDDIDKEAVYVKYFDLSLQKDLVKIIVTEDGTTREISVSPSAGLQKVEIHRKKVKSTIVKFVYNITVKNEGQIEGYATEITDYIPTGLEFIADENKQWTKVSDNKVTTNALANQLLKPGETASVQITLKWINGDDNFGLKTNTAEISADKNNSDTHDIDSTPNNKIPGEDDIDNAEVMLQVSTGTAHTYIALTTTVLMILATGIALIKKFVL